MSAFFVKLVPKVEDFAKEHAIIEAVALKLKYLNEYIGCTSNMSKIFTVLSSFFFFFINI